KTLPFRRVILQAGKALNAYWRHPKVLSFAFVITILSHLAYYLTFYCAGRSVSGSTGRSADLMDVLSIMPLVNTMTGLPISIGGVGLREILFQELLGKLAHVPPALAALTASLGFLIQASWSLLGAIAFLLPSRNR